MSHWTIEEKFGDILVNGELPERIGDGFRWVGCTHNGEIIKCDLPPYVIHPDWNNDDDDPYYNQTKTERELLPHIEDEDLVHFPRIIDHGTINVAEIECSWILQEKIKIENGEILTEKLWEQVRDLADKYGITDLQSSDMNINTRISDEWNYTICDGRIVIYDWGVNSFSLGY